MICFALVASASAPVAAQMGLPYLAEDEEPPAKTKPPPKEERPAEPAHEPPAATASPAEPRHDPESFARLWAGRRQALAVGDQKSAQGLLAQLLTEKRTAGWPNMFVYAAALARETERAVADNKVERALELAAATVELAPDAPESHIVLARAAWAKGSTGLAVKSYLRAYLSSWTEPPMVRNRLGNLALAVLGALLVACGVFALAVLYRHFRIIVHDIHHILPKGATRLQSGIFGVAAFLVPVFLHLGPAWWAVVWITLLGVYYERRERIGATVVLAVLAAVPLVLPWATAHLAYPGSRAEAVYLAARDMGANAAAARLAASKKPSAGELFVLGLRAKWSGDLDRAADLLARAERSGSRDPVLLTTLGNIEFQLDDTDGAITYYKKAIDVDPDHTVAFFNLSRVYHSLAESKKANEAYRAATEIDYSLVEEMKEAQRLVGRKYVRHEEVPAYVADVALVPGSAHGRTIEEVWRWLGGRQTPRFLFSAITLGCVILMIVMAWLRVVFRPAAACSRCGIPACRRCNPEMKDQTQCGQCYHAFVATGGVDPQARVKKEIEVHRFQARTARIRRVVSLMVVGSGHMLAGRSLKGLAFLAGFVACTVGVLLGLGVIPDPLPYLTRTSRLSTGVAGVLAVAVYIVGLWDTQRGERR